MLLLKYIMRGYLYLRFFFHKITRTGTFGKGGAAIIPRPFKKASNPLKNALFHHHIKQFHESSCSVASMVTVINAILEISPQNHCPATQQAILEKVRTAHWKERMEPNGYKGRRGLPLKVLGQVVKAGLEAYGINYHALETVQARGGKKYAQALRKNLLYRLKQFETRGNCLIIAHFDQGSFVRDLNIPHISPVGGFDPDTQQVTMLDVDPFQPNPYQISFDTFYKGISTHYNHVFKPFGYGRGGYVFIHLPSIS